MTSQKELTSITTRIGIEVMEALQRSTGRTLWNLSENNRLRLYRLWIWSQRYSVSLDYILKVLVAYFTKGVEKRTGKRSKGLGVTVPVITGDVAEEVLQTAIARDFPESDHLSLYREEQITKAMAILDPPEEFAVKYKTTLQYKTISEEAKAYARTINRSINKAGKIEKR